MAILPFLSSLQFAAALQTNQWQHHWKEKKRKVEYAANTATWSIRPCLFVRTAGAMFVFYRDTSGCRQHFLSFSGSPAVVLVALLSYFSSWLSGSFLVFFWLSTMFLVWFVSVLVYWSCIFLVSINIVNLIMCLCKVHPTLNLSFPTWFVCLVQITRFLIEYTSAVCLMFLSLPHTYRDSIILLKRGGH